MEGRRAHGDRGRVATDTLRGPDPAAPVPEAATLPPGLLSLAIADLWLVGPRAVTTLQRTAGNRAVAEVLQRQPNRRARTPAPPPPTNDQIAAEIGSGLGGPFADYDAFVGSLTAGTFLGHTIRNGVRAEFLTKLRDAESRIDDEYTMSGNRKPADYGISSIGGYRRAAGLHGWGIAIDIDVAKNPYVMHEAGEADIDAQTAPVYHRIARFILNSPITTRNGSEDSAIPAIISSGGPLQVGGSTGRRDRLGEYFDRLTLESDAMKKYFELMNDQAKLTAFLAGEWQTKHPRETPPAADEVTRQMWQDFAALGGAVPTGGPPGIPGFTPPGRVSGGDRPFNPTSAGQQDPGLGFLTIPREVVLGLGQAVSRWGAIDFGGASGDVQHFDDGAGSLGRTIAAAKRAAQVKINAAAAAAAAATQTPTVSPTRTTAQRRKEPGEGSEEGGVYSDGPAEPSTPAALTDEQRLSGAHWKTIADDRWGGGEDPPTTAGLEAGFAGDLQRFRDMLAANSISSTLTSAFRPKQRSYLFKYCLDVQNGRIKPSAVPAMDGVEIIWDHGNEAASKSAAEALAKAFGLVGIAAHPSNHNSGTAVDMKMDFAGNASNKISYKVDGKDVTRTIKVDDEAREGVSARGKKISGIGSRELSKAGADFGVKRALDNDIVHWSRSGR